jgi:hypothetical protein
MRSQIRVHSFLVGPPGMLIVLAENGDIIELELCESEVLMSLWENSLRLLLLELMQSQKLEVPE